jgi:hypothetical protein
MAARRHSAVAVNAVEALAAQPPLFRRRLRTRMYAKSRTTKTTIRMM